MAVELLRGMKTREESEDFMKRLLTSGTIQVSFGKPGFEFIRFPEVLACAASKRFRDICRDTESRSITLEQLFRGMGSYYYSETVQLWIRQFAEWLYTSELPELDDWAYSCEYFAMWGFASILEAPEFEKAAIYRLQKGCSKETEKNLAALKASSLLNIRDSLEEIWEGADFSPDRRRSFDITKGEIFWGNKKALLFLLDAAAWQGWDNEEVRAIVRHGGDEAVALHMRMMLVASGEITGPPWAEENIEKYLPDDTIPDAEEE